MKRGKSLSLTQFANDLHRLANLAYPDQADQVKDKAAKEKFVKCLPKSLRWAVLAEEPASLVDAKNKAIKHYHIRRIDENAAGTSDSEEEEVTTEGKRSKIQANTIGLADRISRLESLSEANTQTFEKMGEVLEQVSAKISGMGRGEFKPMSAVTVVVN